MQYLNVLISSSSSYVQKMEDFYVKEVIVRLHDVMQNIKYDLAQNIIHYKSPMTLEYLTLTKIAIFFWKQESIWVKIYHLLDPYYSTHSFERLYRDGWRYIEEEVLRRANLVIMPKCSRDTLTAICKPIGKQILKFLTCFYHPDLSADSLRKSYFANICWSYQGTINTRKTAETLIENTDLSLEDKYVISCNNCLEEKIRTLHRLLPDEFILKYMTEKRYRFVLYWTYYVREDNTSFMKYVHSDCNADPEVSSNIPNYLLHWAVKQENEVAVQFIYENYENAAIKECLPKYTKMSSCPRYSDSMDIYCFFLPKLTINQHLLCLNVFFNVLVTLLDTWRWRDIVLPAAQLVLKCIRSMDIFDAFRVLFRWNDNMFAKGERARLLIEIIDKFQNQISHNFQALVNDNFDFIFSQDLDIIKYFLSRVPIEKKKRFMLTDGLGLFHCGKLVRSGKLDIVNICMREMLETESCINGFKELFLKKSAADIYIDLVIDGEYELVEAFLQMFVSPGMVGRFKIVMTCMKGESILANLRETEKNKYLYWAFDGDEEEIADYCSEAL